MGPCPPWCIVAPSPFQLMSSPRITIACAIDEKYMLPLAVMLESLRQHLQPGAHPELYLIHRGIPAKKLAVIASIIETRSLVLDPARLAAAPRDAHFPPEASIAMLLPGLLPPGLDRVLFLDADLLVLDDLLELWQTPLAGHVVAAVPDGAVPQCSSARGVKNWK
jgi:lipopolysaccharide biosynthesis glycosyltransferase